jgi:von Willebrand factor type A domain-containing protein
MHLDSRLKAAVAVAGSAGLLLALAAGGGASSAGAAPLPNCTPATNLEAIIDDSGSMAATDPDRFRADLVDILATFNPDKSMGAVQFGTDASVLFAPAPIGPNLATIRGALGLIQADDGGTDYEAGFNLANAQNPNANARIFLSDGAPNFDPDPNVWRAPPTKTYVVGFGTVDPAVLNQIAVDTGGPAPLNVTNSSELRTVAMIMNARINCEPDPVVISKAFKRQGQVKGLGFKADGNTSEVVISWPTGAKFKVFGFAQGKGGGKSSAASIAKKRRGPKVRTSRGASFVAVSLSRLRKGKVRFKVRAKRLAGRTNVTAAIIR